METIYMDRDGNDHRHHHRHFDLSPIIIVLFGIMAGSAIVAAYQCIVARSCRSRRRTTISSPDQNGSQSVPPRQHATTRHVLNMIGSSTNPAVEAQPPASICFRIREFEEAKCAVCLSELNEGEEIRVLPECGHAFHMVCVDMWLFSHSNCPLCRGKTDKTQHVIVVPMHSSSSGSSSSGSASDQLQSQITGSQET